MLCTPASSPRAAAALALASSLQRRFVDQLQALGGPPLTEVEWGRDGGRHGGGVRFVTGETAVFNRVAVNVSSVHYDDEPQRPLAGATALSTIIHPHHPLTPSVHLHLSHTELRGGTGTWRLMADLNPSNDDPADEARFVDCLKAAAPELYADASAQGDRYFFIPALGRYRGITHFYAEEFSSGDFERDRALAERVGTAVIDTYAQLLAQARRPPTDEERARQLVYHTLYFFQVLTLDRGTTSGLLVHDQNDLGIMGSLPSWVDRALLGSWLPRMAPPQDALLRELIGALPEPQPSHLTDEVRQALAAIVRGHYRAHPEAIALQASGLVVPATVDHHR